MDQASNLRNIIKLQNQRNIQNARVITVTGGKGGVGKSNTAINLASGFAKEGKRVIIFDADFGLANIEVMFGTVPKYTLSDVLYGQKKIKDIITEGPSGIGFISGGSGITNMNNLNEAQIRRAVGLLSGLDDLCDILIVDTGAGISNEVLDFVLASPEVIMVITPEPGSVTDSYALLKALYANPKFLADTRIYLCANRVSGEIEGRAVFDKMNQVVTKFLYGKIEYLGMVPTDTALEKCVRAQNVVSLVMPQAKSSKAFFDICDKLLTEESEKVPQRGIHGFFNTFLKRG